jgi:hypothetical protein
VAHPQTDGRRNTNALTSFLFCNKAATYSAKDADTSCSFSVADDNGKRETIALDTSSLFLIRNKAAAIAAAKSEEEEEKQPPKGSSLCQREAASRGSCTDRRRARSRSVTEAGGKSSQGSQSSRTGRGAGYGLAG